MAGRARYVIISDIHGNLEALRSAIAAVEAKGGVKGWICLGDIVGYNPDPNQCTALVRNLAMATLLGNHDEASAIHLKENWFNPYAEAAVRWTARQLTAENKEYLAGLQPFEEIKLAGNPVTIAHGTSHELAPFGYIRSTVDAREQAERQKTAVCFIGHTHRAGFFVIDKNGAAFTPATYGGEIRIEPGKKYVINVGSVGQPRDGNPQGAFALYTPGEGSVEIHRFDYPVAATQAKMREAGLPEPLISRLGAGV